MPRTLFSILFLFQILSYSAQNTIGTITIDPDVTEGYTLFTISTSTFLINNCGEVINTWSSTFPPGNAVYLLGDGSILRAGKTSSNNVPIGGQGGVVEKYDWDGNLTWQFFYDDPNFRQHHDIFPMPNGNVLILAATLMSEADALQAGRNPALLSSPNLYNEQIIEVEPTGFSTGNIVWEWNIKDHFIQDFDNTKDNFGVVADNPQLLDINYTSSGSTSANWLHINSIQYDEILDQIVLSSRNLSELFIIDHSTTTVEAASHSGGTYGRGGDLLYRWGNPEAYKRGTALDRQLYGQHFPHFIRNSISDNGKLIVFNNGNGRSPSFSEVFVLEPPTAAPGVYNIDPILPFEPIVPNYIYTDPNPTDFYSAIISGAQRLSNGHTLIMEGTKGRIFEIDSAENILWEYIVPVSAIDGSFATQGDDPALLSNNTFRALKYSPNYSAFDGRPLTPGNPLEINPDITACLSSLTLNESEKNSISLFPNPTKSLIEISTASVIEKVELFNMNGELVLSIINSKTINISGFAKGIYIAKIQTGKRTDIRKIIKN